MDKTNNISALTTIGIDRQTGKLIDKLCKRYSLKKGEIVRLAFVYIDKACINPSEAPESVKSELAKINKRQDDIIRFIRHYEEEQLNPMIRTAHSIAVRFDTIGKTLETLILSQLESTQGKQLTALYQIHQRDYKKLLQLIQLYSELSTCGVMDGKRKENLKAEIINLINT